MWGEPVDLTPFTDADADAFQREMGRPARGVLAVAYRCAHGVPAVVQTAPRLPDGTPFPTMFYLCCSALTAASTGSAAATSPEGVGDAATAAGTTRTAGESSGPTEASDTTEPWYESLWGTLSGGAS
jgi:hypothetical protein